MKYGVGILRNGEYWSACIRLYGAGKLAAAYCKHDMGRFVACRAKGLATSRIG